eukprot:scaffold117422_cov17-Tisochrysis_lutea.AAC.1
MNEVLQLSFPTFVMVCTSVGTRTPAHNSCELVLSQLVHVKDCPYEPGLSLSFQCTHRHYRCNYSLRYLSRSCSEPPTGALPLPDLVDRACVLAEARVVTCLSAYDTAIVFSLLPTRMD